MGHITDLSSRFWLISDMHLYKEEHAMFFLQNFSVTLTVMLYMNIYSVIFSVNNKYAYLTFQCILMPILHSIDKYQMPPWTLNPY